MKNHNRKDIQNQKSETPIEENFVRIPLNKELVYWIEKRLIRFREGTLGIFFPEDTKTSKSFFNSKSTSELSLSYFLENGFFLSGGYARHLYYLNDLLNRRKIQNLDEALFLNFFNIDSDIDLWAKSESVLQKFGIEKPEKSGKVFQSFAHNVHIYFPKMFGQKLKQETSELLLGVSISEKEIERYSTGTLALEANHAGTKKMQFISAFLGQPESVMGGFDIENCKFAIEMNQSGEPEIIASKLAISAEQEKKLLLSTRKPYNKQLALTRVKKYLQKFSKFTLHEASFAKLNQMVFEACIGESKLNGWLESVFYFAENDMIDPTLVTPAISKYSARQLHKKSGCIFYSKHQVENNPDLFFLVSHGQKMPSESHIRGFDSHSFTAEFKQVIALDEDVFSVAKSIKNLVNEDKKAHLLGASYSELYENVESSIEFVAFINSLKQNNNKFNRAKIFFSKI